MMDFSSCIAIYTVLDARGVKGAKHGVRGGKGGKYCARGSKGVKHGVRVQGA